MKRVNSTDIPAALHSAKVISLVALHLAREATVLKLAPSTAVTRALEILGYPLTREHVATTTDPTIVRALVLVTKGLQS